MSEAMLRSELLPTVHGQNKTKADKHYPQDK
jgi:hypothetical protein